MINIFKFFNKNKNWGYPECDHLNVVLRMLLESPFPNHKAIREICYAVIKTNGYFYEDVKEMLELEGIWKF